jgi:predicted nucleic-acid-binding protein
VISLDTNVIVRVVTADDPDQLAIALKIMRSPDLWLCRTVLLEIEWVLRYSYKLSRQTILETFTRILGYPNLAVEETGTVSLALDLFGEGMDFGDALHLASSKGADRFVTFDRNLSLAAQGHTDLPPVELLTAKAG